MSTEKPEVESLGATGHPLSHRWKHYIDVTEVLKNVVTLLGAVTGGAWILYTFGALKQAEFADVQLSRMSSRLSIKIDAEVRETSEGTCVFANVKLENIGTRPVKVSSRWGKKMFPEDKESILDYHPPVALYKVRFSQAGDVRIPSDEDIKKHIKGHPLTIPAADGDKKKKGNILSLKSWDLIRVGEVRRLPFVMRVVEPGLYLLTYRTRSEVNEEEDEIYNEFAGKSSKAAVWSASTYVIVNEVKAIPESGRDTEYSKPHK